MRSPSRRDQMRYFDEDPYPRTPQDVRDAMIYPYGHYAGPQPNADKLLEDEPLYFDSKPIVGWRQWYVKERDGELAISSLYYKATWEPGKALQAVCGDHFNVEDMTAKTTPRYQHIMPDDPTKKITGTFDHTAPHSGHLVGCGVYAYALDHEAPNITRASRVHGYEWQTVTGYVYLWGRVLVYETGYRAQYAYPKAFILPHAMAKKVEYELGDLLKLGDTYKVPWVEAPPEEAA